MRLPSDVANEIARLMRDPDALRSELGAMISKAMMDGSDSFRWGQSRTKKSPVGADGLSRQ